jgi:hypothetical protein
MDNKKNQQAQLQQKPPVSWPLPHHPHKSSSKSKKGDEPTAAAAPPVLEPRPRWKFVAQTINTRELKKAQQKSKNQGRRRRGRGYCNNDPTNSLVEEDGVLRVATVADVSSVAWKPTRKNDFIYKTVQDAWLAHILHNRPHAWGKQQAPNKAPVVTEEPEKMDDAAADAADTADTADDKESETKKDASAETGEDETLSEAKAATGDKDEDDNSK